MSTIVVSSGVTSSGLVLSEDQAVLVYSGGTTVGTVLGANLSATETVRLGWRNT